MSEGLLEIVPGVSRFRDTCNVYVLRSGDEAVLVDFGDGGVLDVLDARVTDVLLTHHHRDQLGGLARALEAGIRVWAPEGERELIAGADDRWRRRQLANDYDLREDRFAPLASVPVTGTVADYGTARYGPFEIEALPTPGHTIGSLTYLVELEGRRLAFSGDLVHGDGGVWSLAATQWTYSGIEGLGATIVSASVLAGRDPDLLLPSHGEPVERPAEALGLLAERLQELVDLRLPEPWSVLERVREPFEPVTPHLLRNRTMFANSYVLLSENGGALVVDFGHDTLCTTISTERPARRTLLWSLEALRRDHGVERIEAAVVTHYHDDHVAGLNRLREVEGAEVWAPANVAPILEHPERHDLPCLWFDPIPVDRVLALGEPVRWHEYELTPHSLPGHTRFAAALEVEVDGRRVLFTGDQQTGDEGRSILNYQYRNRFLPEDFARSAELYRRLRPDLILGGHWLPQEVTDELIEALAADAERLAELHRELLPAEGFGTDGVGARIEPYRSRPGETEFEVWVRNPFDHAETARVRLAVPEGWAAEPAERELALEAHGEGTVSFRVRSDAPGRFAAELRVGEARFGAQAEAVVL